MCRGYAICFHSSGNAEDMFTSEGTGVRRAPSPLLVSLEVLQHPDACVCSLYPEPSSKHFPHMSLYKPGLSLLQPPSNSNTKLIPTVLSQEWCRRHQFQLLAVQLPGRGQRLKEGPISSLQELSEALLPVLAPLLQEGLPYVVVGHSMGCWAAYEVLRRLAGEGG